MKDFIRKFFFDCNIPLTTNLKNDILLKKIIKRVFKADFNTIDIGCHKGEILEILMQHAPKGMHFAVEPIPYFYNKLKKIFPQVNVLPYALSDKPGVEQFYWIKHNPALSGLHKRKFNESNTDIQTIPVEVKRLDEIIPQNIKIHFIKIDVEGAEMQVLKGASQIIGTHKPFIAFEFGIGGSEYYHTTPVDLFNFFEQHQYHIFSFENFLLNKKPYTLQEFEKVYQENIIYNFIAVAEHL